MVIHDLTTKCAIIRYKSHLRQNRNHVFQISTGSLLISTQGLLHHINLCISTHDTSQTRTHYQCIICWRIGAFLLCAIFYWEIRGECIAISAGNLKTPHVPGPIQTGPKTGQATFYTCSCPDLGQGFRQDLGNWVLRSQFIHFRLICRPKNFF